jgi:hypothetical protein
MHGVVREEWNCGDPAPEGGKPADPTWSEGVSLSPSQQLVSPSVSLSPSVRADEVISPANSRRGSIVAATEGFCEVQLSVRTALE